MLPACFVRLFSSAVLGLAVVGLCFSAFAQGPEAPPPVKMTAQEDMVRMCQLLNVEPILKRPAYNYDESKANPFPNLPDPLLLKNGQKVTDAETWWTKRRPEILEDFEREVYGRTPKVTPKVTWEVLSTTQTMNGDFPVILKQLVGHVDNSAYPQITVNIRVAVATPEKAEGKVPVMLQFSSQAFNRIFGGEGRGRGPGPGAAGGRGPGGGGPNWEQQLLAKGWGYAAIDTASVQADNGAGLTAGIIGLVNKGQPRKLDDWGALAAWSWGASRALDYFETDPHVDAKRVGLQGHSRWGKATLLATALDQRFATAYVSSSGAGGARLHRRDYGQPLDAVTIPEEYHWMAGNYLKYAHRKWDELPVDSHELVALCAPRPVMITGGTNGDRGVDTRGMFMAAAGAGSVYQLLGKKGLSVTEMPAPDVALIDGDVAFRQHEGGHTDALNWPSFIEFASRHLQPAAKVAP